MTIRFFLLFLTFALALAIPTLNNKQIQREEFEMKVKEYCSKKNTMKGLCQLAWNNKGNTLKEMLKLSIPMAVSRLMPDTGVKGMPFYMLAHTVISRTTDHLGTLVDKIGTSISTVHAYKMLFEHFQKSTEKQVSQLSEELQSVIRVLDTQIEYTLNNEDNRNFEEKEVLEALEMRQLGLLAIPTVPKNIMSNTFGGTQEGKMIDKNVKQLLKTVPKKHQEILETLINRIRMNSSPQYKTPHRAQAYFYGPPGTGKTRFARELAKALNLPLCEFDMKQKTEDDLFGMAYYRREKSDIHVIEKQLGSLAKCLIEAGVTNPIIFLDEAGDYLTPSSNAMDMMKKLFDPSTNNVRVYDHKFKLDISRVTFILAGNQKLENNALKSRLPTFEFDSLSPVIKKKIVVTAFEGQMKEMAELYPQNLVQKIRNAIKKYLDYISELDIKLSLGGRISQEVIRDFSHYVLAKIANNAFIKEKAAKQYIKTVFDQRIGELTAPKKKFTKVSHLNKFI